MTNPQRVPPGVRTRFGQKHILIVDDEPGLCNTLKERLELRKFKVDVCYDGDSAIDLLVEKGEGVFDLVVLDMWVPRDRSSEDPELDPTRGEKILQRCRLLDLRTPILIVTNYPQFEHCVECIKHGATDYLPKDDPLLKRDNTIAEIILRCERILDPQPSAEAVWLSSNLDTLVEKAPGRCGAAYEEKTSEGCHVFTTLINGKRVLFADTLHEVQLVALRDRTLRWLVPYLFEIPKSV